MQLAPENTVIITSALNEAAIADQRNFWYSFEYGDSKRFKRTKCTSPLTKARPKEIREGWPMLTVET
jgi:hypothetical protein